MSLARLKLYIKNTNVSGVAFPTESGQIRAKNGVVRRDLKQSVLDMKNVEAWKALIN